MERSRTRGKTNSKIGLCSIISHAKKLRAMKKIIFTMTMLSLSIFSHCQNAKATQVSFGRYGADCSSGRGTCSFNVLKSNPAIVYLRKSRRISVDTIELEMDQKDLSKAEQVRIFGIPLSEVNPGETTFFVQEDALLLDKETLESLQIDAQYATIAAGYYPMTVTRDKVKIVFTLQGPSSKD